jgi:D-alanine-D-alanine ligase
MKIPYTGASADAQFITSHKPLAKQLMQAADIVTPFWMTLEHLRDHDLDEPLAHDRWIIKSLWEHASVGLNDDSLITTNDPRTLLRAIEDRLHRLGGAGFAEEYIDGREFNLALLADPLSLDRKRSHESRRSAEGEGRGEGVGPDGGPQALPPAEIVFQDYPADRPHIVGYSAKWDEHSFAYRHTPRRLDFPRKDAPLLNKLKGIALHCWHAFDLTGYTRVDFRVDHDNQPFVLEINTNPCLSPDAGFAAVLQHAGVGYTQAIERILADAMRFAPCPPPT